MWRSSAAEDAQLFGLLDIEGSSGHLIDFTRQFFPDVRSLTSIAAGEGMIYADVGLPKKIPLPALGDGAARLVSYYLAAFHVKSGGILLLDEVGSGIHHSQLPRLWEGLRSLPSTSHAKSLRRRTATSVLKRQHVCEINCMATSSAIYASINSRTPEKYR